jgi:nicotinamide phosphoribosyltransferase
MKARLVVRPDSGKPVEVVVKTVRILDECFGSTVNSKGFKVLHPKVRVIQGDGVNLTSIIEIMEALMAAGYAIENVCFGMGAGLLQLVGRDDYRFAMKTSAVYINGSGAIFDDGGWRDVWKNPATDHSKQSKAGIQYVVFFGGTYQSFNQHTVGYQGLANLLKDVWDTGTLLVNWTWDEVRANSN